MIKLELTPRVYIQLASAETGVLIIDGKEVSEFRPEVMRTWARELNAFADYVDRYTPPAEFADNPFNKAFEWTLNKPGLGQILQEGITWFINQDKSDDPKIA